ncbi:MAG: aromatic ring-hydroxylating dioxygenase subunit alpha [SAR324 cluster bacterium]|nr:aromatic ring-hydroxylating dioxygenase subunit alpha [SAR324 cluster bacterium]
MGHESQVPNPGDFFISRMGEESVILCRDDQGRLHVFLNTCRHRGMKVCRYDKGNTKLFTCPYHAWSYTTDGRLFGVPQYKTLYEGVLDREKWSLVEVPRMENFKGGIWASWDPDAPDFLRWLGDAKQHLDQVMDCRDGREGGSEVFGGVHRWVIPTNWKFPAENFLGDTYHTVSHLSVDMVGISPSGKKGQKGRRDDELADAQHVWVNFPQGHGVHSAIKPESNQYLVSFKDNPDVEAWYRHCFEERKRRLGEKSRLLPFTGTIFPNTSYNGRQPRALCVWHPHGPHHTEVWRFYMVDADAPPEVKDMLRRYYMRYSGPAGMTEQDDMENWNYATAASRGTIARRYPYNYQQSMNAWSEGGELPGRVSTQITEQNARNYYRQWARFLRGASWEELLVSGDPETPQSASAD